MNAQHWCFIPIDRLASDAGTSVVEVIVLAVVAFTLTLALTRPLINWLRAREFGKAIRVDGPAHAAKSGTPTMGGLGMLAVIGAAAVYLAWRLGTPLPLQIVFCMVLFGALGLVDDLAGLVRRSGRGELGVGLTARRMFALQVGAAAVALVVLGVPLSPTAGISALVMVVAVLGTVNGVNMSDGLDGLAAGLCVLAFTAVTVALTLLPHDCRGCAIRELQDQVALIGVGMVTAAGCLGFLVFNRHPARVFMGNVTSMALGSGLAAIVLAQARVLCAAFGVLGTLPVIGGVFVVEVLSVLGQVAWFKITGGRRILRMAPIHHHFEAVGWSETTVVFRFWLAGAIAGLIGLAWVGWRAYAVLVPAPN